MVLATIALIVAVAGTSYALTLPRNSVGTRQLKNKAVTAKKLKTSAVSKPKIKKGAVNGAKVANDSLTGADILESSLAGINAARLGGIGPGGFIQGSGRAVGGTATFDTGGPTASTRLAELPGLPAIEGVWSTPPADCDVQLAMSDANRYVNEIVSNNGTLFGDHDSGPGSQTLAGVDASGEGAVSVGQVTTRGSAPQVFTYIASVRMQDPECITSVLVLGT